MSKRGTLSRRAMLQGLGTALALPWLEGMREAWGAAGESPPRRMVFLFVPNGAHMPAWKPEKEGPLEKLPPTLEPLEPFRQDLLVLSNLALDGGRPHGDGPGDHARCAASFLTGAHPRKTHGKDIHNGVSVDQAAASKIGHLTRFPSLELGCEPGAQAGNCDSGYSCIYSSNISWRSPTSAMTKEVNPQAVFDRLFGGPSASESQEARGRQRRERKSILDFVAEDAGRLRQDLGTTDRRKLDEYLYAVRQVERRIDDSEKIVSPDREGANFPRPAGVPREFGEHVNLMLEMTVLALATDSTRIASFMFSNAGSNRSYPQIGVSAGHHELSHHDGRREKQEGIAKINHYHVTLLAGFLKRLKETPQLDGRTLLDQTMIVYGSGLSDGNRHNHDDLPVLLAGHGGGTIRPGRHLSYASDTPMTNLYLSLLQRMGVSAPSFGDSTGVLRELDA